MPCQIGTLYAHSQKNTLFGRGVPSGSVGGALAMELQQRYRGNWTQVVICRFWHELPGVNLQHPGWNDYKSIPRISPFVVSFTLNLGSLQVNARPSCDVAVVCTIEVISCLLEDVRILFVPCLRQCRSIPHITLFSRAHLKLWFVEHVDSDLFSRTSNENRVRLGDRQGVDWWTLWMWSDRTKTELMNIVSFGGTQTGYQNKRVPKRQVFKTQKTCHSDIFDTPFGCCKRDTQTGAKTHRHQNAYFLEI